jgi:hypothetical protein
MIDWMKWAAPALGLLAAPASPALARETAPANVRTEATFSRPAQVVAGGIVWRCADQACAAALPIETRAQRIACRRLGERIGRIVSIDVAGNTWPNEAIAFCNRERAARN